MARLLRVNNLIPDLKKMIDDGSLPLEKIAEFSGLSIEKVRELAGNKSA